MNFFMNILWMKGNGIKNEDFDQSTYLRLLKSYSDKISKHFIYLPIYFFIKCKIFTIFHILFQLRRCCWKRTRKDFMAAKLVVTNPGNTLTSVGILNPAMSIWKSPAFSVTLYLKPIVLIGNMWNGTILQKYYLSTGNLGNDIKKKEKKIGRTSLSGVRRGYMPPQLKIKISKK